jgi:hypothetical protein
MAFLYVTKKDRLKVLYAKTGNLRLVQKINRSLILNLIKDKGPISRADISKITNLLDPLFPTSLSIS